MILVANSRERSEIARKNRNVFLQSALMHAAETGFSAVSTNFASNVCVSSALISIAGAICFPNSQLRGRTRTRHTAQFGGKTHENPKRVDFSPQIIEKVNEQKGNARRNETKNGERKKGLKELHIFVGSTYVLHSFPLVRRAKKKREHSRALYICTEQH